MARLRQAATPDDVFQRHRAVRPGASDQNYFSIRNNVRSPHRKQLWEYAGMKIHVLICGAALALSGCQNQFEITGTNANGTETFKGSALGFQAGKFNIKSNKGRKCKGRFESANDLASGYGKGNFVCTDGNEGTFWFNIEENYKSGNGVAYIGGEKFRFKYGKQT